MGEKGGTGGGAPGPEAPSRNLRACLPQRPGALRPSYPAPPTQECFDLILNCSSLGGQQIRMHAITPQLWGPPFVALHPFFQLPSRRFKLQASNALLEASCTTADCVDTGILFLSANLYTGSGNDPIRENYASPSFEAC